MSKGSDQFWQNIRRRLKGIAKHSKGDLRTSRYDSSDVVQESILQLFLTMEKTEWDFEFNSSYLSKLGHGNATRLRRFHTAQRRSAILDQHLREQESSEPSDPQKIAESKELVLKLMKSIRTLDDQSQQLVFQRFFGSLTFEELGRTTGLSSHAARRRYDAAIRKLTVLMNQPPS